MYEGNQMQAGSGLLGRADKVISVPGAQQERIHAVPDALIYQEARLQDLDSIVDKLCRELHVVLRPASPSDPTSTKESPNPIALVEAISKNSARIEFNCRVLADLLNRLEL